MIHPDNYSQYAEDYLLDNLNEKQLESFESQLSTHPELAREVDIQRAIIEQVETLGALKTEERLLKIKAQYHSKQRIVRMRWLSLAAASVIGLLVIFGLLREGPHSSPQLYADYYQAYEIPLVNRGEIEKEVFNAAQLYKGKKYREALPLFQQLYKNHPEHSAYQLAIGICQLETQQSDQALQSFSQLIQNQDPQYSEQAIWYTALAYLQKEEPQKAREFLQKLATGNNTFHQAKAQDLLEKIKNK